MQNDAIPVQQARENAAKAATPVTFQLIGFFAGMQSASLQTGTSVDQGSALKPQRIYGKPGNIYVTY